jgi:hypothetical protein
VSFSGTRVSGREQIAPPHFEQRVTSMPVSRKSSSGHVSILPVASGAADGAELDAGEGARASSSFRAVTSLVLTLPVRAQA